MLCGVIELSVLIRITAAPLSIGVAGVNSLILILIGLMLRKDVGGGSPRLSGSFIRACTRKQKKNNRHVIVLNQSR